MIPYGGGWVIKAGWKQAEANSQSDLTIVKARGEY